MNDERLVRAIEWLRFALGDLEAARSQPGRHVHPRHVANHAQQAAEKALKAGLTLDGISPPRTHDLDHLRNRLDDRWQIKRRLPDLTRLSDYGIDARYPDNALQVTAIASATAVRQGIAVVKWIRIDFDRFGVGTTDLKSR